MLKTFPIEKWKQKNKKSILRKDIEREDKIISLKGKRRGEIKEVILLTIVFIIMGIAIIIRSSSNIIGNVNDDFYTYSMRGELQGNHVVLENGKPVEVPEEYANYTSEAKEVTVVLNNNGTEDSEDDTVLDILGR